MEKQTGHKATNNAGEWAVRTCRIVIHLPSAT